MPLIARRLQRCWSLGPALLAAGTVLGFLEQSLVGNLLWAGALVLLPATVVIAMADGLAADRQARCHLLLAAAPLSRVALWLGEFAAGAVLLVACAVAALGGWTLGLGLASGAVTPNASLAAADVVVLAAVWGVSLGACTHVASGLTRSVLGAAVAGALSAGLCLGGVWALAEYVTSLPSRPSVAFSGGSPVIALSTALQTAATAWLLMAGAWAYAGTAPLEHGLRLHRTLVAGLCGLTLIALAAVGWGLWLAR